MTSRFLPDSDMSASLDSLTVAVPEAGDFLETLEPYSVIISRNT